MMDTWSRRATSLLTLALTVAVPIVSAVALPGVSHAQGPAAARGPAVLKFTPNMPASAFAGRPDSDLVELSDGRRLSLGDVRRLRAAAQRMRAASGDRRPAALLAAPRATGARVANSADLANALKGKDQDTLVLPSGRRVTVGMIHLLQPYLERRLGRPLTRPAPHARLTGPAIKVGATPDWKSILERPDGTVLEAPDGTRITVGQLKQALAALPAVEAPTRGSR